MLAQSYGNFSMLQTACWIIFILLAEPDQWHGFQNWAKNAYDENT